MHTLTEWNVCCDVIFECLSNCLAICIFSIYGVISGLGKLFLKNCLLQPSWAASVLFFFTEAVWGTACHNQIKGEKSSAELLFKRILHLDFSLYLTGHWHHNPCYIAIRGHVYLGTADQVKPRANQNHFLQIRNQDLLKV